MAETVILTHRGPQIIQNIAVFDEGQYGAGEVELRDRYETFDEVKTALTEVLAVSPIEDPDNPENPLSFRRFDARNKWGSRLPIKPGDAYPFKSQYLVHFLLVFRFHDDFCYIDVGVRWAPFIDSETKKFNPKYPLGKYKFGDLITLEDLRILRICCCTLEDAIILAQKVGIPTPVENVPTSPGDMTEEQLEELLDGKTVLVVTDDGSEPYLTYNNDILTEGE